MNLAYVVFADPMANKLQICALIVYKNLLVHFTGYTFPHIANVVPHIDTIA